MKSGSCLKCGCNRIIVAQAGEYSGESSLEMPMTVTAEPRWVLAGRNPRHGFGQLHLYVCAQCGYAEWYAVDPGKIPIGEGYKTRWLDAPSPARQNEQTDPP